MKHSFDTAPASEDDYWADPRLNFTLDAQTLRLILLLAKMTDSPSYSELIRQCIVMLKMLTKYFQNGDKLEIVYKTGRTEIADANYFGISTATPGSSIKKNRRKDFRVTPRTKSLIEAIKKATKFKSASEVLRYAVRIYYAASTASTDGGKVLLRSADGSESSVKNADFRQILSFHWPKRGCGRWPKEG